MTRCVLWSLVFLILGLILGKWLGQPTAKTITVGEQTIWKERATPIEWTQLQGDLPLSPIQIVGTLWNKAGSLKEPSRSLEIWNLGMDPQSIAIQSLRINDPSLMVEAWWLRYFCGGKALVFADISRDDHLEATITKIYDIKIIEGIPATLDEIVGDPGRLQGLVIQTSGIIRKAHEGWQLCDAKTTSPDGAIAGVHIEVRSLNLDADQWARLLTDGTKVTIHAMFTPPLRIDSPTVIGRFVLLHRVDFR